MSGEDGATAPRYAPNVALVVVDVQNDFADPAGSLYVTGGDEIIAGINVQIAAARAGGATVVQTQDWHPPRTPHFIEGGGTWPVHCVRNTWGAESHPDLSEEADLVLRKGTGGEDGYSAFTVLDPDSGAARPTGLAGYLNEREITDVVIVGLAADVCVKATALDAVSAGFGSVVLWDLSRAVEIEDGDGDRARKELIGASVVLVGSAG
ncbi:MAG: isochorismatase family protein [Microthrixaceae bacterium]